MGNNPNFLAEGEKIKRFSKNTTYLQLKIVYDKTITNNGSLNYTIQKR